MDHSLSINLTGKVAFVSAGAAGIGKIISQTLLSVGANVFVCDIDKVVLEKFLLQHPKAKGIAADISNIQSVEKIYRAIQEHYGRLDILVNNAGIAGPTASIGEIDAQEWEQCINVDLNGQFYCTNHAIDLLKKNGGSIINIASNAAFFGFPQRGAYTASKWAMIGLTKTWAMELGKHKIRVNAICPGSVNGPRIERVIMNDANHRGMSPQQIKDVYQKQSSMRIFVEPEDVANMVIFLVSSLGQSISGQAIGIDGHTEGLSNWLDQ